MRIAENVGTENAEIKIREIQTVDSGATIGNVGLNGQFFEHLLNFSHCIASYGKPDSQVFGAVMRYG